MRKTAPGKKPALHIAISPFLLPQTRAGSVLLEDAQQKPSCNQTTKAFDDAATCHDSAPAEHQYTEVYRWSFEIEEDGVARNLTQNIWHEKDHGSNIVIAAPHLEAGF